MLNEYSFPAAPAVEMQPQSDMRNTEGHTAIDKAEIARGHPKMVGGQFRLGMPHMDVGGVNRSWLLREACHVHWHEISSQIGSPPSTFYDNDNARVLPSVVASTVNGEADRFKEDDWCQFALCETPCAENGWRSQLDLISDSGPVLRAEIVTAFARRCGPSNRDLSLIHI